MKAARFDKGMRSKFTLSELAERLDREAPPALAAALHLTSASGDTDKILWRLHDETTVETVLIGNLLLRPV